MPTTGWTVAALIAEANGRTENRATNKPNFNTAMEFFLGLDEFCLSKHYWWRRKVASFATVANQQQYDISKSVASGGANAPDAEEIEEAFIVNASPFQHPKNVNPRFTAKEIVASIFGNNAIQGYIPHEGFFMVPGQFQMWDFTQAPESVFTVGFTYWAIPMVSNTGAAMNLPPPLVPPFLHYGLVTIIERRILRYLYGQGDERLATVEKDYEDFKNQAAKSKQFSSQEARHSSMQMPSVSSHGGRGYRGGRW